MNARGSESHATSDLTYETFLKASMAIPRYGPKIEIIASSAMVERRLKRMCRSKRKRIRKKWLKNEKNWETVPRGDVLFMNRERVAVCHPSVAAKLRRSLVEGEDALMLRGDLLWQ